jgi:hypothetical protein
VIDWERILVATATATAAAAAAAIIIAAIVAKNTCSAKSHALDTDAEFEIGNSRRSDRQLALDGIGLHVCGT